MAAAAGTSGMNACPKCEMGISCGYINTFFSFCSTNNMFDGLCVIVINHGLFFDGLSKNGDTPAHGRQFC